MKTKYLFGMLLSGAMLAACTADDDFNTAKVKQDVNPSAPVFTVHFDDADLQNRAIYNMSGSNMDNLSFQADKDLLSLFHGMPYTEGYTSTSVGYCGYKVDGSEDKYMEMKGWQNAIYKGENKDDANTFTFTTQAMVNKGRSILIYPGDTGFNNGLDANNNGEKAPNITISPDQDEKTKELTPYMSEIINIGAYDASKDADVAGYAKTYDIALKRVGSTLFLNLALANTPKLNEALGVKDIKIEKVAFEVKKGGKKPFTYSVPVKVKNKKGATWNTNIKPAAYDEANKKHLTWFAASELDLESEDLLATDKITSSDVTTRNLDNAQVIFTLLPFKKDVELKSADQNGSDEVVVTLYTNYGTVEVSEEDIYDNNLKPWVGKNNGEGENMKITDGLNGIISKYVWKPQTVTTSLFYSENPDLCENVGAAIERTLNVQMKDQLDMNGLHVKTDTALVEAIKVYQYLHPNAETPIYFYLDGDAKNGVFTMTDGTWETMMAARNGKNNNGKGAIYCVPCKKGGEVCKAVKLVNTDKAEGAEIEVPELKFGDNTENATADIQLDGNWKYTNAKKNNENKNFQNVGKLVVLNNAHLELANTIYGNVSSIDVEYKGYIDITGTVNTFVNINNNGVITIEAGEVLNVDGQSVLENLASNTAGNGYDTTGAGVIENSGFLNVINTNMDAAINNYGVINNNTKGARTMITKNSSDDDVVAKPFGKKNVGHRIGTINLYQEGENIMSVSILEADNQGFIKLTVTKENPVYADFGSFANYIVASGDYKEIKWECAKNADGTYDRASAGLYLPRRIKYIEVAEGMDEVTFVGSFNNGTQTGGNRAGLDALIVPATSEVLIPVTATVQMNENSAVLAAGHIWYAGKEHFDFTTNTGVTFGVSYFGGTAGNADITNGHLHNYAGKE